VNKLLLGIMLLMVIATVSTPVFADEDNDSSERDYDDDSHERDYDDDSHERDYDDDSHERDYDDDSHERDYDDDSHERDETILDEIEEHLLGESEENEFHDSFDDVDDDFLNKVKEHEITQNAEMSVTAIMDGTNIIKINGETTSAQEVSLLIRAPNENLVTIDQITPDVNGIFGTDVIIGGQQWSQDGIYTIIAKQGNSSLNEIKLTIDVNGGVTAETTITETSVINEFEESLFIKSEDNEDHQYENERQDEDILHYENDEIEYDEIEHEDDFKTPSIESKNPENFMDTLKKLFASWFGF